MILSILICHLNNRGTLLKRLLDCLQPQVNRANARASFSPIPGKVVEILIETDAGQASTGEKRNKLLTRARGRFVAFSDDDDLLSERYVELVLKALESDPDCVSLEGIMYRENFKPRRFSHSIAHGKEWREEMTGERRYLRPSNHLNAVRRDLALQVGFPDKKIGEDRDYSERLFPLLKKEAVVSEILYFYYA